MVDYEQMSVPELQCRTYKFLASMFQYWCKTKVSKYLRIEKFCLNMVLFGLAPSTQYLEKVILNFDEQLERPVVSSGLNQKKEKPYNRFFVYKVAKDGSLSISHLSLDTLYEIYRVNKYCYALQRLLKRHLTQRYVKQVMQKLAKQGQGLDLK